MYNGKRILALIPARGGSKGLPGKNIRELAGKPLIAWTIETAVSNPYIDKTVVSTDSDEIADVARRYRAEVPFLRPSRLSTDKAKGIDVSRHAVQWLKDHDDFFDLILTLQPTSPLRQLEDVTNAIELFFKKTARAVVSVCECQHHPWWTNRLPEDNSLDGFLRPEALNTNRQDLPTYYQLNGAIYLTTVKNMLCENIIYGQDGYAYIMPRERSVDIDTVEDLKFAELYINQKKSGHTDNE